MRRILVSLTQRSMKDISMKQSQPEANLLTIFCLMIKIFLVLAKADLIKDTCHKEISFLEETMKNPFIWKVYPRGEGSKKIGVTLDFPIIHSMIDISVNQIWIVLINHAAEDIQRSLKPTRCQDPTVTDSQNLIMMA